MSIARRGRSLAVSGFLLAGTAGIVSSTQTWLTVTRADAGEPILVPGADAVPLLAPLSLAVLASGAALAISAPVVRLVFAILAGGTAGLLGWSTARILFSAPMEAVGPTVTEKTGLAGGEALRETIGAVTPTAWPAIALVGWALLLASVVLILLTWRGWKTGGRRYRTDATGAAPTEGPVDAVDSWDELSRGTDPTR